MKKIISACLFFLFCAAVLVFFYPSKQKEKQEELLPAPIPIAQEHTKEPTEEKLQEIINVQEPYMYMVKIAEGMLVVYESDGETMLFETNIWAANLDEQTRQKAEAGIGFLDEMELYDFLESHSS